MSIQACHHRIISHIQNISFGEYFEIITRLIRVEEQNNCICKIWVGKLEFCDYNAMRHEIKVLEESFQDACYGHVFSKPFQFAIVEK